MNDRFPHLEIYENTPIGIDEEFRKKWIIPFYRNVLNVNKYDDDNWIQYMISIKDQITNEITLKNLGDYGWRSRITGAYFAAIKNAADYIDIIGTHLLKSRSGHAGQEFAVYLGFINEPRATKYLIEYLDFYLEQPQWGIDQVSVLEALQYLDEINGTKHISLYNEKWKAFCQFKMNDLNKTLSEDSNEYKKSIEEFSNSWTFNLERSKLRRKINALKKIKDGSY